MPSCHEKKVSYLQDSQNAIVDSMSDLGHGPRTEFRNNQTSMSLTSKWSLFFSSMFDASQLPAYTACFRLPKNAQLDAAEGHLADLRSLNHPVCYPPEGAPSTCCLFSRAGEAAWAFFFLWNAIPSFLKARVSVADSWSTTCSWVWNQASCSWPPSGDLTKHLQACAGGLGQVVPDSAFFFVVFLTSNDWRTWVNHALCKTQLLKKRTSERLSLLFISIIEIYNPLSALLLTLVCHQSTICFSELPFSYSMLLFLQTLKWDKQNCPQKLFLGNLPTQICPIFYRTSLRNAFIFHRVFIGTCSFDR